MHTTQTHLNKSLKLNKQSILKYIRVNSQHRGPQRRNLLKYIG